jgi:hypothetical protein
MAGVLVYRTKSAEKMDKNRFQSIADQADACHAEHGHAAEGSGTATVIGSLNA